MGKIKHKSQKQHHKRQGIVLPGAPLFTRTITLKDVVEVSGSQIAGNGLQRAYFSANGNSNPDQTTPNLPQPRIFNQYAPMFEYYQINKIYARFIPYKWESAKATAGVTQVNARPTYSIIDPEVDSPGTPSGFMSYDNCHVTAPYSENVRSINYMNIALQKQDKLTLLTNGSHQNRELYTRPTAISFLAQCPAFNTEPIGVVEYHYSITFSGQVGPGLEALKQPQGTLSLPDMSKPTNHNTEITSGTVTQVSSMPPPMMTYEEAMALAEKVKR